MHTKAYVRFFSRAAHLDTDIELADVVKIAIAQGLLNQSGGTHIFDPVNPSQHPRLGSRSNTANSRKLAINHLKATLCEAFIKNIYEDLLQYLQEVLTAAAKNGLAPNRLIGDHKVSFEANDVLLAGNWRNVVEMVSKSVFRKMENERSTKKLLEKMNSKLNLGVKKKTIDNTLPYLEIRHLLVHAEGKADNKFCNSFPQFNLSVGQKNKLDYNLLKKTRKTVCDLVTEFDKKIISKSIVATSEMQK